MRSVVSGVRNSCPASCTSRRCCSREAASASNIALKLVARLPSSSSRSTSILWSSRRVVVTRLAAAVNCFTGRRAPRETSQPSSAAARTPTPPTASAWIPALRNSESTSAMSRPIWTVEPSEPEVTRTR